MAHGMDLTHGAPSSGPWCCPWVCTEPHTAGLALCVGPGTYPTHSTCSKNQVSHGTHPRLAGVWGAPRAAQILGVAVTGSRCSMGPGLTGVGAMCSSHSRTHTACGTHSSWAGTCARCTSHVAQSHTRWEECHAVQVLKQVLLPSSQHRGGGGCLWAQSSLAPLIQPVGAHEFDTSALVC